MKPPVRAAIAAGLAACAALAAACDDRSDPRPTPPPAPPESRPAGGAAPRTDTIVAREGDRLVVIVDVAPEDALGRAVKEVAIEGGPPGSETRTSAAKVGEALTLELRVPASTRELRLVGTSEGGASWTKILPTALDGR